jgi:hypothetical protein
MTYALQHYQEALELLVHEGVRFCVIGTYGLLLHGIDLSNYKMRDCDLMCAKDQLKAFATTMHSAGWAMTVWEEPLPMPFTEQQIDGKFYIRCKKNEHQIDMTYEHDSFAIEPIVQSAQMIDGVPVASIEWIITLKRSTKRARDLEFLSAYGLMS